LTQLVVNNALAILDSPLFQFAGVAKPSRYYKTAFLRRWPISTATRRKDLAKGVSPWNLRKPRPLSRAAATLVLTEPGEILLPLRDNGTSPLNELYTLDK
jgi:hypothetical protein